MDTDINYIIQMSLNGDKNSQEILLKRLRPVIFKNIYRHWRPMDTLIEDLEQEGYLLILESLRDFDINRNVHFLHYIKIKLFYFYKNYYRKVKKNKENMTLRENISFEITDFNNTNLNDELVAELMNNIKKLSLKEQEILYLYFCQQMSMKEIYKYLNISYRTCIGRKYSAIKKLKKLMGN